MSVISIPVQDLMDLTALVDTWTHESPSRESLRVAQSKLRLLLAHVLPERKAIVVNDNDDEELILPAETMSDEEEEEESPERGFDSDGYPVNWWRGSCDDESGCMPTNKGSYKWIDKIRSIAWFSSNASSTKGIAHHKSRELWGRASAESITIRFDTLHYQKKTKCILCGVKKELSCSVYFDPIDHEQVERSNENKGEDSWSYLDVSGTEAKDGTLLAMYGYWPQKWTALSVYEGEWTSVGSCCAMRLAIVTLITHYIRACRLHPPATFDEWASLGHIDDLVDGFVRLHEEGSFMGTWEASARNKQFMERLSPHLEKMYDENRRGL